MSLLFLNPGDWFFGRRQGRAETILGSCVSILIWHPSLRVVGLCHCLLPQQKRMDEQARKGLYVDHTVRWFVSQIQRQHLSPQHFDCWLFGGGDMFPDIASKSDIGWQNQQAARLGLVEHGFVIKGQDVGGSCYRRLCVDCQTGDAMVQASMVKPLSQARLTAAGHRPPKFHGS